MPATRLCTPRTPGTLTGDLAGSFSDPTVCPQVYTSPVRSTTAKEHIPPQDTEVIFSPDGNGTSSGTDRWSDTWTPRPAVPVSTPAWPYSLPPHANKRPVGSAAHACQPPSDAHETAVFELVFSLAFSSSCSAALFDAAASAVTAFGYGIHSSSTSWPSVSCEFHPQVYSEPVEDRTALLREPARMALVDGYLPVGDATVSPCGRVTIVGVSTCQSRAHLLWETGASGRPSWPSSPQPHCGRREEGWSGWGSTRGGLESIATSLNFHRREEGKRPPWIDGSKGWEREAGRTTNRVSTPSSSAASAISKVEL